MEKQYRYPGARPFSEADRALFFGRDQDIRLLSSRVTLEKLVVLFGKSGYGKTSLLQAGVLPRLRKEEGHRIIEIRLSGPDDNPLDLMIAQLKTQLGEAPFIGDTLNLVSELPDDLPSLLWSYLKSIQLASPKHPWITLVFDQFEELFSFHQPHVESFGRALAALLDPKPPKPVRRIIKQQVLAGKLNDSEIDPWLVPLNLKVLLSLRHDHLSSLDGLKEYVPAIFKHTYELQPLNGMQALEVLQKPAALEGAYKSPPFTYSQAALDKIVTALKDKRTQRIETFQLQLIAQYAEEKIIEKANKRKPDKEAQQQPFELAAQDIADPDLIFENHYQEIIGGVPRKVQGIARDLVEKKLIIKGNRVPLPQQVITEHHKVPVLILDTLVEKRLLRAELNSVGTTSYELSHDTLVAPIERSARKRRQRILRKRLTGAGLALLLLLLSSGVWAIAEMIRADSLEKDNQALRDSVNLLKGQRATNTTETKWRTQTILLIQEKEILEAELKDLKEKYDSLSKVTPVVLPPVVIVDPNGPVPNPIDDKLFVTLPSELYSDWIKKLNALKTKLVEKPDAEYARVAAQEGPSDTRPPAQWSFNTNDLQLVAVRINTGRRIFDARNPKAFFLLLAEGQVYKFLGGTGYFTKENDLAFLAKGQHLYRLGSPRSEGTLVPNANGVRLIRDVDKDAALSENDIERGFYKSPSLDAALRWTSGSNSITEPGQQLIFNQYYINPFNLIEPPADGPDEPGRQQAFDRFKSMVWDLQPSAVIPFTLVDLSDFDKSTREEIEQDINRLKTGLNTYRRRDSSGN